MSDKLPPLYRTYRMVWSVVHTGLLVLGMVLLTVWWNTDGNGAELYASWAGFIEEVRTTVGNAVPYPWG